MPSSASPCTKTQDFDRAAVFFGIRNPYGEVGRFFGFVHPIAAKLLENYENLQKYQGIELCFLDMVWLFWHNFAFYAFSLTKV